jgi:hypothetical protein
MKVYVLPTGRHIEPFGDPPAEALIQNRPLAEWQAEMIADARMERIPSLAPPCLVIPDALFTTGAVLRRLADGAGGRNAVLVLRESAFARQTTPVQPSVAQCDAGYRFEAVRFVSGGDESPADVVCDPEERVVEVPVPGPFADGGKVEIALALHPVMTLHHWVHILWANRAAGGMQARRASKVRLALRAAAAAARTLSLNRWRVLGRLNEIGKGCDIHPTAVVEGSTLDDGVTIGPFARVLFSRLGRKATVMAAAQVDACVLGEGATVSQQTTVRLSVLYPGAIAGQRLMQMCVLGRNALTVEGSWSIDLNLERDSRVPLDGVLHSTGTRFLGSAFGHGSRVGTGFWMAPGRMIPNDAFVVCAPDQLLSRIDAALPPGIPAANDRGDLRPLKRP